MPQLCIYMTPYRSWFMEEWEKVKHLNKFKGLLLLGKFFLCFRVFYSYMSVAAHMSNDYIIIVLLASGQIN